MVGGMGLVRKDDGLDSKSYFIAFILIYETFLNIFYN